MSEPIHGDLNVDIGVRKLLHRLRAFSDHLAKNCSENLLAELHESLLRAQAVTFKHWRIKMLQKAGGVKGARRSHG